MPLLDSQDENRKKAKENQERAFIAASRRNDRSLEARVASARAASAIHKERTGKAFRITEEIVLKEEMYEEEEDENTHRAMIAAAAAAAAAAGDSPLSMRVMAYVSSKTALCDIKRHTAVDREFAERFGPLMAQQQQIQQATYYNPGCFPMANHFSQAPLPYAPQMQYPIPQHAPFGMQRDTSHSVAQISPYTANELQCHTQPHGLESRHPSFDDSTATPALSPGSTQTLTPLSTATPKYQPEEGSQEAFSMMDIEPFMDPMLNAPVSDWHRSSFTPELPNDVKAFMGTVTDPLAELISGDGELLGTSFGGHQPYYSYPPASDPRDVPIPSHEPYNDGGQYSSVIQSPHLESYTGLFPGQDSQVDEATNMQDDWMTFINDGDDKDDCS